MRFDKHVELWKGDVDLMETHLSTDFCLRNIVDETLENHWKFCRLNNGCIKQFFDKNRLYSGYWLTHQ